MSVQKLKETIIGTAVYYGRQMTPEVLQMMVEDLEDLDPVACEQAYRAWRRNPKNKTFPLPAQIREVVAPEESIDPEDLAREIAARIVGAVPKFGWCNAREAEKFIGPEGWEIVRRQGGWSYICENLGVTMSPSTFQAQLRDQLKANLKHGLGAIDRRVTLGEGGAVPALGEGRGES